MVNCVFFCASIRKTGLPQSSHSMERSRNRNFDVSDSAKRRTHRSLILFFPHPVLKESTLAEDATCGVRNSYKNSAVKPTGKLQGSRRCILNTVNSSVQSLSRSVIPKQTKKTTSFFYLLFVTEKKLLESRVEKERINFFRTLHCPYRCNRI